MPLWPPDQGLCPWTPLGTPPSDPHHSEEIAATVDVHLLHFIYPAVRNTNAMCTICNLQQSWGAVTY